MNPTTDIVELVPAKATGMRRLGRALGCTIAGWRHAFTHEAAFRLEAVACSIFVPLATLLPVGRLDRLVLILSMLLVLLAELLNSAIEAAIDRISLERHPLSGRAKDLGSAAVGVALVMCALCWLVIAGPVLFEWMWP